MGKLMQDLDNIKDDKANMKTRTNLIDNYFSKSGVPVVDDAKKKKVQIS
jgi:hypothetical protein